MEKRARDKVVAALGVAQLQSQGAGSEESRGASVP